MMAEGRRLNRNMFEEVGSANAPQPGPQPNQGERKDEGQNLGDQPIVPVERQGQQGSQPAQSQRPEVQEVEPQKFDRSMLEEVKDPETVSFAQRESFKVGPYGVPYRVPQPQPEAESGEFMKGLKRGWYQTAALGYGGLGAASSALGFEDFAEEQMREYDRLMREAEQYAPEVEKVEDIDSPGKFISWAASNLGEQVPNIVGALLSGGIGSITGKLAARKLISKSAKEMLEAKAKQWANRGALGGVVGYASTVETGGIYGEQREAGKDEPLVAIGAGTLAGSLEALPIVTVARHLGFGKQMTGKVMSSIRQLSRPKRAAAMGALISGQEAGTEAAQEVIALAARDFVDENYDALGEEGRSRILNATAAGGFVGGGMGTLGGAISARERTFQESALVGPQRSEQASTGQISQPEQLPPPPKRLPPPSAMSEYAKAADDLTPGPGVDTGTGVYSLDDGGISEVDTETFLREVEQKAENIPVDETSAPLLDMIRQETGQEPISLEEVDVSAPEQTTEPEITEKGTRGVQEEVIPAGEAAEGSSLFEDFVMNAEGQEASLSILEVDTDEKVEAVQQLDREYQAQPSNIRTEWKDRYEAVRQEIVRSLPEAEQTKLSRDRGQQRRSNREEAQEARRRVERRRAQEGQQAQTQQQSDQVAEEELRKLGYDPDEVNLDDFMEGKAEKDRFVRRSRMTDHHFNKVKNAIDEELKNFPNAPETTVAMSFDPEVFPWGQRIGQIAVRSRGIYDKNNNHIYIVADNIQSPSRAKETLLHEMVAHGGINQLMTEQERKDFLSHVERSIDLDQVMQEYGTQDKMKAAEEYVAKIAEDGTNVPLFRRIVAFFRRVLRRVMPDLKLTNDEIRSILKDMHRYFQGGPMPRFSQRQYVTSHADSGRSYRFRAAAYTDNLMSKLDISETDTAQLAKDVENLGSVWGANFKRLFLTPLQLSQEYGLEPMRRYYETVARWWNTKSEVLNSAEGTVSRWNRLGKTRSQNLSKALFESTLRSDELGRRLSPQELQELFDQKGIKLDEETRDMFWEIDKSMQQLMNRMERGLKYNVARETLEDADLADRVLQRWEQLGGQPAARWDIIEREFGVTGRSGTFLDSRLNEIDQQFEQLRNRNYFPLMRFGKFSIGVFANADGIEYNGKTYNKGEVITFETFESRNPQSGRAEELKQEFGGQDVKIHQGELDDREFSFLGMPPTLMDNIQNELELSEAQKESLKEIFLRMSPGRSFLRHLLKRKGIEGFSADALRTYASYMANAGGHLARIEHYLDMQKEINDMQVMSDRLKESANDTDTVVLDKLRKDTEEHYEWIMNPRSEWAQLRAAGFMWYLGFNPRSAAVNLTQVPMVAYPYLADRYGDGASVREIGRAFKTVANLLRGRKSDAEDWLQQGLMDGMNEGFINESLSTEISGAAEGSVLQRIMPQDRATRLMNGVSYYGGWMFTKAEQYNRQVTFTAAMRLAMKRGETYEQAYDAGRAAVRATMFEYAKWNRPKFMRGKKSVFFLFWQFMQHASYLAAGRHGSGTAMRFWLMLGMAAGLQGLPFAEVIMDIINNVGSKFKQAMGMENPRVNIQEDLRELASGITDNPDIVMHGWSRYFGLGPLHVLEAFGAPVPNTDVSGSLSMGMFPPGIEPLAAQGQDPDTKFARTISEVAGPVFGIPYSFWRAMTDPNPDSWKRWERAMPTMLKNASSAIRYGTRGEETLRGGAQLIDFDPYDLEHRAEQVAQALGFPPTRKNEAYEVRAAKHNARRYWLTRRTLLMEDFAYARRIGDREGVADARKAVREFNKNVPSPALRISYDDIYQSIQQRARRRNLTERGLPNEKMLRRLYQDLDRLYSGGGQQ